MKAQQYTKILSRCCPHCKIAAIVVCCAFGRHPLWGEHGCWPDQTCAVELLISFGSSAWGTWGLSQACLGPHLRPAASRGLHLGALATSSHLQSPQGPASADSTHAPNQEATAPSWWHFGVGHTNHKQAAVPWLCHTPGSILLSRV